MEATLLARNPSRQKRGLSPGIIIRGWAFLSYAGKPIGLLGKGDRLDHDAFEPPVEIVPIGSLVVGECGLEPGLNQASILKCVGRHTTRLSASALARTADLLTELADKIDRDGENVLELDLPLSQSQLADLLGLSVVHMNRTMMQLKTGNLIRYGKGPLTILDRPRLARLYAAIHD